MLLGIAQHDDLISFSSVWLLFFSLPLCLCDSFLPFCLLLCISVAPPRYPGALQIEMSEESDQGKYECVATNSDGTRYSTPANLYVRGKATPAHVNQKFLYIKILY